MSRAFLFRAKCDLVQALVTAGFALHHDVFVSKARIPRRKIGMNMELQGTSRNKMFIFDDVA